jgi:MerR family redox-sensitive transcriptional activator SoxR
MEQHTLEKRTLEQRTIGQVAQEVGMRPSTLRYYERIGLLPPAERIGGQRRYAPEIVQRLEMIAAAKEIGFSLDEIKLLLDGLSPGSPPSERWQAIAEAKLPEVEKLIGRAQSMKRILEMGLNCECITIADCFEQISG